MPRPNWLFPALKKSMPNQHEPEILRFHAGRSRYVADQLQSIARLDNDRLLRCEGGTLQSRVFVVEQGHFLRLAIENVIGCRRIASPRGDNPFPVGAVAADQIDKARYFTTDLGKISFHFRIEKNPLPRGIVE